MRFFYNEWKHDGFPNSLNQVKNNIALQTSMSRVANRPEKLDATVAKHVDAIRTQMKSMNENLSQLTAVMTQLPAVMTVAIAASTNDLMSTSVRVSGGARSSGVGWYHRRSLNNILYQFRTRASLCPCHPVTWVQLTPASLESWMLWIQKTGHCGRDCLKRTNTGASGCWGLQKSNCYTKRRRATNCEPVCR